VIDVTSNHSEFNLENVALEDLNLEYGILSNYHR